MGDGKPDGKALEINDEPPETDDHAGESKPDGKALEINDDPTETKAD